MAHLVPVTSAEAPRPAACSEPGRLVVVEGPDGAGKTTQVERLATYLGALTTAEPGGTGLGRRLRALLLDGPSVSPRAEALMMAADRAEHVDRVLRPALAAGRDVVCSRFTYSTVAYQGVGRGLGAEAVLALDGFARDGLEPDLVVVLDLDPEASAARIPGRGAPDRIEAAGDVFHTKVRAALLALAANDPRAVVIDADGDIDGVADRVRTAVEAAGIHPRPLTP